MEKKRDWSLLTAAIWLCLAMQDATRAVNSYDDSYWGFLGYTALSLLFALLAVMVIYRKFDQISAPDKS